MKNRDAHAFIKKRKRNRSIPDAQRAWLEPPRKPYRVPQKRSHTACRALPFPPGKGPDKEGGQ